MSKLQSSDTVLTSYTKNQIPVHGTINLQLHLVNTSKSHRFYVTEKDDTDFLIGLDFLQKADLQIDFGEKVIYNRWGDWYDLNYSPESIKKRVKIRCDRTTILDSNTVQYVTAKLQGIHPRQESNFLGIVEPYRNTEIKTSCLIASSLNKSHGNAVTVQFLNPADEPVTIYKNQFLGYFHPMDMGAPLMNVNSVKWHIPEVTAVRVLSINKALADCVCFG